jgi:putative transposase
MARQPRIDLAGVPQHVIQRGNNREACFFEDDDRHHYLEWLRKAAEQYGVFVHAYVLMTNHVHLLATGTGVGAIGRTMQSLGRRYVRYVNSSYQRTGTLWEGRYKSCLVDSDRYLLTCYRYIELNPVRAGMVRTPGDYRWSSYNRNALGMADDVVTAHASYESMGRSDAERFLAYQDLFRTAIEDDDLEAIRRHVAQGKVLGSEAFRNQVEAVVNRRVRLAGPGRPRNVL